MQLIIGERGSGKTTKIIEEFLKDENGILLVQSYKRKEYILKRYPNVNKEKVLVVFNFKVRTRGISDFNLYIDDIDTVLSRLLDKEVCCGTITGYKNVSNK